MQISESHGEPEENSLYSVASKTTSVRVQKAVDPEVAALLDDSDVSRLGSDVEDLEEDFVLQANLLEDDDEEKNRICNKTSFPEESLVNRNPNSAHALQVSAHSRDTDDYEPFHGVTDGVPGVDCVGEKPRPRRLLDEQFDLVSFPIHNILFCVSILWSSVAFSLGIKVFNEACRASFFPVSEEDTFAKFFRCYNCKYYVFIECPCLLAYVSHSLHISVTA